MICSKSWNLGLTLLANVVGEVADLLQFETVYQFSNQYKKVHGHSPGRILIADRQLVQRIQMPLPVPPLGVVFG